MNKNAKKIIAVTVTAVLVFSGCSSGSEIVEEPAAAATASSTTHATVKETEASESTEKSEETAASLTEEAVASSAATTTTTAKPATTTTAAATTQAPVTTTTTTVTTTKPVETTAPTHNCDKDGHKWSVAYVTSEPKWCRETHEVFDFGFDLTLCIRYFPNINDHYGTYINTLSKMGVEGNSGMATVEVEIWGTETYEVKTCKVCGAINTDYGTLTITPIGEWQYVNGVNPRMINDIGLDFNTLHWDPYNIPQKVIDNINAYWDIMMPWR